MMIKMCAARIERGQEEARTCFSTLLTTLPYLEYEESEISFAYWSNDFLKNGGQTERRMLFDGPSPFARTFKNGLRATRGKTVLDPGGSHNFLVSRLTTRGHMTRQSLFLHLLGSSNPIIFFRNTTFIHFRINYTLKK